MRAGASAALAAVLTGVSWIGAIGIAHADPVVVVQVRRPRAEDGAARETTVVLRDADGVIGTCRTENGTCEIRGVPPGRHTVSAQLEAGDETPGRPVLIPPDGKVMLFVAVP